MHSKNEAGIGTISIALIIVVLAVIGSISVLVWHNNSTTKPANLNSQQKVVSSSKQQTSTTQTKAVTDPYAGWKTYSNQQYGLSFRYPVNWSVEESGSNQAGIDPTDFNVILNFNSDQKYKMAVEIAIHTQGLSSTTKYYDDIYAQSSLTVNKKNLSLKGKQVAEYDITDGPLPTKLYLFSVGDKTYSFGSGISDNALQDTTPDYPSNFSKTFDSLAIQ